MGFRAETSQIDPMMAHTAIAVLALLAFAGSVVQAQLNADQKSVLLTTHNERRSSVDASNMLQLVSSSSTEHT